MRRLGAVAFLSALVLGERPVGAREKTDVIRLKDGDRITGEIRGLRRGKLRVKTEKMGTMDIDWDEVDGITSNFRFEVETDSGARHYGALTAASTDTLAVVEGPVPTVLSRAEVVNITPLGESFLQHIDLSLDAGFTFTEANQTTQFNLNATGHYRGTKYSTAARFASLFSGQQDSDSTTRNELQFTTTRFLGNRWYVGVLGDLLQSEELGLDLRSVGGGLLGRELLLSNRWVVSAFGGVVYTNEKFSTDGTVHNNAESMGGLSVEFITLAKHDTYAGTSFVVFPSLSSFGRVRLQLNARVSRKIVSGFTVSLNLFETFDSDPPSATASRNDFGITTSAGWTF